MYSRMAAAVLVAGLAVVQGVKPVRIKDFSEVSQRRQGGRLSLHVANKEPLRFADSVKVNVEMDENGVVTSAEGEGGAYVGQAVDLVRQQRYAPFLRDGRAVPARFQEYVSVLPLERKPTKIVPMPEVKDWTSVRMRLSRTGCVGSCPSYEVEITGTGQIVFEGESFTAVTGQHHAIVAASSARELWRELRKAEFFSLEDSYTDSVMDSPSYTLELAYDGMSKKVLDYVGQSAGMPDVVTRLEDELDRVTGSERWIVGSESTIAALKAEHWDFRRDVTLLPGLVQQGDETAVLMAIEEGAPLGATSKDEGESALAGAARRGYRGAMAAILDRQKFSQRELDHALLAAA